MQDSFVSGDDMRYLVQQTPENLTTIVGQMTSLVQDITDLRNNTDERIKVMEKQPWYKKMWMTITGKNKSSKNEIQKNQDKVVGYVSEAVSQLYQMNCIDQQVMCSLGNRMNQVYAQITEVYNEQLHMKAQMAEIMAVQQQTIQALGGFVTKLNEKIESVDNFHMLITEIQQGQYKDPNKLYSLCCILAQLDRHTLEDGRKLNILREALAQSDIINEKSITIQQYLMNILSLSDDKVGIVYLELCNFRNSFPANLFAEMIESYHFLPKIEKMSKSKDILIQELLSKYKLDAFAEFSFADVSESFLENKYSNLISLTDIPKIEMTASTSRTQAQSVSSSSNSEPASSKSFSPIDSTEIQEGTYYICPSTDLGQSICFDPSHPFSGFPALLRNNHKEKYMRLKLVKQNNCFIIKNINGRVLSYSNAKNKHIAVFEENDGNERHQWRFKSVEDGYYIIVSALDENYCLEACWNNLKLSKRNSSSAQKFYIKPV